MAEWWDEHRHHGTNSTLSLFRHPWAVSVRWRASKRLDHVAYFNDEKAAKAYKHHLTHYADGDKDTNYIVKIEHHQFG